MCLRLHKRCSKCSCTLALHDTAHMICLANTGTGRIPSKLYEDTAHDLALPMQVRRLRSELASREEALAEAARQLEHEREQVDELERQLMIQASQNMPDSSVSTLQTANSFACAA